MKIIWKLNSCMHEYSYTEDNARSTFISEMYFTWSVIALKSIMLHKKLVAAGSNPTP